MWQYVYMATNTNTRNNNTAKADEVFARLTAQVIEAMETNPGQWTQPWTSALVDGGLPYSIGSGKAYQGGNVFVCLSAQVEKGYARSAWGTFNQWAEFLGAERKGRSWDRQIVAKGEKATVILQPKTYKTDKDRNGQPLPEGKTRTAVAGFRGLAVFNAAQVIGAEELLAEAEGDRPVFDPIESAQEFVEACGADTVHTGGRAFYTPAFDRITLPAPEAFNSPEAYYATRVHELAHWTGHESRLNREGITGERTAERYAFEELVAELTAVFVGSGLLGLSAEPRPDHAQYLAHWVAQLREEPKVLWQAASKAQAAAGFLAGLQEAKVERELVAAA